MRKVQLTTRRMLTFALLLALVGVAVGVSIVAAQGEKAEGCAPTEHRHRYSDVRIALVEVTETDACGFRFSDLERPLIDRVTFSASFVVSEAEEEQGADGYRTLLLPRSSLRARQRGLIAYCGVCRAVFSFKMWSKKK